MKLPAKEQAAIMELTRRSAEIAIRSRSAFDAIRYLNLRLERLECEAAELIEMLREQVEALPASERGE